MDRPDEKKFEDNKFLAIISENWDAFKKRFPAFNTPHCNRSVDSIIRCGDPEFGFNQHLCLSCGEDSRIISHSCKSKLCLRCGRVDGENFAQSVADKLHQDVSYRHLVLTIPEQTRTLFYNSRHESDLFNRFIAAGWECARTFVSEALGEEAETGCLMVIHLVGRKCDYKPHLHLMLMSGGISSKDSRWVNIPKDSYKLLNKIWKKVLLKMLREWDQENQHEDLFSFLEKRYRGFVANIDTKDAPKKPRALVRYLSKYLCRPQITLKRLLSYERVKGEVVYSYKSHNTGKKETEKVSVFTFIGRMMQQLLPKGFQRIRYFGLQSNQHRSRLRAKVCEALGLLNLIQDRATAAVSVGKKTYQALVGIWWGYDPLRCKKCGEKMELARIWKPRKGFVFSIFARLFGHDVGPPGSLPGFVFQDA